MAEHLGALIPALPGTALTCEAVHAPRGSGRAGLTLVDMELAVCGVSLGAASLVVEESVVELWGDLLDDEAGGDR